MKTYQFYNTICKNIINGKFDDKKYRQTKSYHGREISTMPLFCSYGIIGFTITVNEGGRQSEIEYDRDMNQLTIDGKHYKDVINLEYLEQNDINLCSDDPVWECEPRSVELETYTDAGEDMIIDLEKPTKIELKKYIEGFDINEEVMMWWENGEHAANEKGVPFDNIREHYEDYESFLKTLQRICNNMPY